MNARIEVSPELLAWARQRSGLPFDDLAQRFPKLAAWERGEQAPTFKQLESYAQATHTAIGFFFLPAPPEDRIPIPDYRTMRDAGVTRPSADLLDTIYQCEQRQDWYRDYAVLNREGPVDVVGSLTTSMSPVEAASVMRTALRFDIDHRGSTWADAFSILTEHAEELGVLVMVNGVVGNNTHRKLNPREFRGFALADQMAPLAFINGADTKAAQIFTLVHELAHLWLGGTALDDGDPAATTGADVERWCSQVAAEVLVPLPSLLAELGPGEPTTATFERLARRFKVSTLVIVRRIYDAGGLDLAGYRAAYDAEWQRIMALVSGRGSTGGNFFNVQPTRAGKRFTRAVVTSALEGQTLYRDALQLLGIKKVCQGTSGSAQWRS
ncbi:MAG TPA: ImmA/IrrE family metallo-endopeptidase [Trebonia sp.]|nr:ImmA/IrrE family metallo-endopeptidase [Trebonia sp.]